MKTIWVGTSWKMNKNAAQAKEWASAVIPALKECDTRVQAFVIPPFPYLVQASELLQNESIKLGAQNMCWQDSGAFTGEVSPLMLKDCGACIVEIGHSERRAMFGETDETVNLKVLSALKHGLTPLVCVGDSAQEKDWGVSTESVVRQVKIALHGVSQDEAAKVILAYEPIWAIGEHGIPATKEEAESVHRVLREVVIEKYGAAIGQAMTLLYGGSVNLENASELLDQPNVDGVFVGRTAWNADGYLELLRIAHSKLWE